MDYKSKIALLDKEIQLLKAKAKFSEKAKAEKVEVVDTSSLSTKEKALFYWTQTATKDKKGRKIGGWKLVRDGIKVVKTWTPKETGKEVSKEFEAVELEKDGKVIQPLFVRNGSMLQVWN